jgi:cytochrome c peroxidase
MFIVVAALFSFQTAMPSDKAYPAYLKQLDEFTQAVTDFRSVVSVAKKHNRKEQLKFQQRYLQLREKYATVEWLFEYMDPEASKNYINGAPLPHLLFNSANLEVVEPEGLQCIDELVFAPAEEFDPQALNLLAQSLETKMKEYTVLQRHSQASVRMMIEAMRFQLIKIFTLKITGFDTPGSLNGLKDAAASLSAMNTYLMHYDPLISKHTKVGSALVHAEFKKAEAYLRTHPDFDSFDRIYFYRQHVSVLYEMLYHIQAQSGVEFYDEVIKTPTTFNYRSKNIFAADFLNRSAYQNIPAALQQNKSLSALGELLFFDPVLSDNGLRSCASCHHPDMAFSDGKAKSIATDFNGTVKRNAPGLINAVFSDRFFYDLRTNSLEDQIDHVVSSDHEFHSSFIMIEQRLSLSTEYIDLFKNAFPMLGKNPINKYSISTAISSYVGSLVAFDSPFDRYMRKETETLSPEVLHGANLFLGKAKCGTCHFAPLFNGMVPPYYKENESEVLGVTTIDDFLHPALDDDLGRSKGQLKEQADIYNHSFKTPTVRNVAFTAPYMHNGAYKDLATVVSFYNAGGGKGLGLDIPNQTLPEDSLGLSEVEMKALVSFMQSLSDTTGLNKRPARLPRMDKQEKFNTRLIGGEY